MEVLEFLDNSGTVLVKRIPDNGNLEIKWGSQLTVRESQDAIFCSHFIEIRLTEKLNLKTVNLLFTLQ